MEAFPRGQMIISITDLHLKPQTSSDLRESFSSIYRYDNVVNVN